MTDASSARLSARRGRQLVLIRIDQIDVVEPDEQMIVLQTSDPAVEVRKQLGSRLDQL